MSYDDLVLEVGQELELTVKEGDFLRVLEQMLILTQTQRPRIKGPIHWSLRQLDKKMKGMVMDLEIGDRIEIVVDLPVKIVLGNRNVRPQDVVDLFDVANGPSRSIQLITGESGTLLFRLAQRSIYDENFSRRHHEISRSDDDAVIGVTVKLKTNAN